MVQPYRRLLTAPPYRASLPRLAYRASLPGPDVAVRGLAGIAADGRGLDYRRRCNPMIFGRKTQMVDSEQALPGRADSPVPGAGQARGERQPPVRPVPGEPRDRDLRPRLLLGRGAQVLAGAGRLGHGRRATRAASPRTRRTRRPAPGRTGHTEAVLVVFDPEQVELRRPAQGVLGDPRPDDAEPAGQRRRHAVPLGDLHDQRRAGEDRGREPRDLPGRPRRGRCRADHDRARPGRRSSTTPRTTTSSTCSRSRTATTATRPRA